jgi:hypothetical protein
MGRYLGEGQFRAHKAAAAQEVFDVTSNLTLDFDNLYYVNTTAAARTLTLPRSPSAGNFVDIIDVAGTFNTNNCIVLPSGDGATVGGFADNLTLNLNQVNIRLQYSAGTNNWVVTQLV